MIIDYSGATAPDLHRLPATRKQRWWTLWQIPAKRNPTPAKVARDRRVPDIMIEM